MAKRIETIRALLGELAPRLGNVPVEELERWRISRKPDSADNDLVEEAARIADAATTIFQLSGKPKPLGKTKLYEKAGKLWATDEDEPGKRWFGRSRQEKFLVATLADWLVEREEGYRESNPRAGARPPAVDSDPLLATPQAKDRLREALRSPLAIVPGLLLVALVLGVGLLNGPAEEPAPESASPTSPAPPADKAFGGGDGTKLYEPSCSILAQSEPDPADANPRLAFVDMTIGGRRIRQPPEEYPGGPTFADIVRLRPLEVVQIAALIQNQGPAATARNVVLRLVFPMHSSTRLSITATVEASNARPTEIYRNAGVVSLVSLTGEPLRLENFRNVQVQRNEATRTNRWGRFENFESCALESKRNDRTFEVAMPSPSTDGSLGVGKNEAYRVVMLADVSPG